MLNVFKVNNRVSCCHYDAFTVGFKLFQQTFSTHQTNILFLALNTYLLNGFVEAPYSLKSF